MRARAAAGRCTPFTHEGCTAVGGKCDFLGYSGGGFGGDPYLVCSAIGTAPVGATCTTNAECRRDHVCVLDPEPSTTGSCTRMCDSSHPCPAGTGTCMTDGFGSLGFCQ